MNKLLVIFLVFSSFIISQNINGRMSTSFYSFERYNSANQSESYIRGFQTLYFNLNKDKFSLKTSLSYEGNLSNSLVGEPRLRLYNLYFEARDLFNLATIKIGRQPLYYSVVGGVFDGVNLTFKYSDYSISGFYGANVPPYQDFNIIENFNDNDVLSLKLKGNPFEEFYFGITYVDKNFKPQPYTALRLVGPELDPINVLIENSSNQYRYLSGDVSYSLNKFADIRARYDYDLNFTTTSRMEFSTRFTNIPKVGIEVYYSYREPRIRYNSIFTVFNYGNTQEVEIGLDYKIDNSTTVFGKFGTVKYETDNSGRLTIGVNSSYGSASYRKTFGYSGELESLSFYSARTFFEGLLTPSIGVAFTGYKLSEDAESNSLISFLLGTNFRPARSVSFDLQMQYLNNKIYNNDLRFLLKFNHWFNSNLGVF